ncbi:MULTISPECIES: WXG100 family type VII secretion target [unclassified Frankia]|uniref:WXG100 family type VII secretion target n=1 Tax=unclassified Frankia TaxID=2632575 RepID=UPI001EF703FB|nr:MULTISPECIES: WXG100 family type VII secretion target [unclassified Frankia]
MANVHVDYAALENTASRLTSGQQEMETQLTQLKALIDNLVGSGFITDQASGKFQASYEQWNTGTRNAIAGLEGMGGFLKLAISQHQQLDATLSQSAGA